MMTKVVLTAGAAVLSLAAYKALSSGKVKDLEGRSVLVTGAAGGLGRSFCLELAKKQQVSSIILWDLLEEEANKTAELIKSLHPGCQVFVQRVNLAERSEIYAAAEECIRQLDGKPPYLVVNNAGIVSGNEGCLDSDDSKIELETKVNTLAHVWMAKAFIPSMAASEGGHFLNVSSIAAFIASGDMTTYAMSKKGARGFGEGLIAEMKLKGLSDKIKVSIFCPGHIQTALFDGFQGDGLTLTPELVAQKMVEAVECERELTILPWVVNLTLPVIMLRELTGRVNMSLKNDFNPMKGWKSSQANKLFSQMDAKL